MNKAHLIEVMAKRVIKRMRKEGQDIPKGTLHLVIKQMTEQLTKDDQANIKANIEAVNEFKRQLNG